MMPIIIIALLISNLSGACSTGDQISADVGLNESLSSAVIYRNPRTYNVTYTFELFPDPANIDRERDLKVWIPVPREWDSQKAVEILAIEPVPHAAYEDPEHGNKILFWDFGKEPVRESYEVSIKYRLEVYEVHGGIDPEQIGNYNKKNRDYTLYTHSTHTLGITPEIKAMAELAIEDETNPYLQAKRIFDFVRKKMRFRNVRHIRGSDVGSILNFPIIDPETGETSYEGQCDHFSIFFVTLCRAAGIPARGVTGFAGWGPWVRKEDLKIRSKRHTEITSEGFAAARLYGPFMGHIWAEFFLPGIGWIPVDPTWGIFGRQRNNKIALSKGRDIKIGPNAPLEGSEGYGDQWLPLHEGRVNATGWGVWNIAKIRIATAIFLHSSDPFPADGYADYAQYLYPENTAAEKLNSWRRDAMLSFYKGGKESVDHNDIFKTHPELNAKREAYLCHLLRRIMGDEKFQRLFQAYLDLRLTSGKPVSTKTFQEIAERLYGVSLDFFFQQWVNKKALPQLRLDNVRMEKGADEWKVSGSLKEDGNAFFRVPIELALETGKGQTSQKIWLNSDITDFEFHTTEKPEKLIVDPEFHVPTIRWMPPRLSMLWDHYPNVTVIYGTMAEMEENKTAAERFIDEFLGLSHEIIKADTEVNDYDLKNSCIILFGRPETNKIARRFQNRFPIKFENDKFTWQGTTYDRATQGVAQIIENPLNPQSMIILYAGLSGDATLKICDKSEWQKELDSNFLIDLNNSFIIYDRHKRLISGDWEDKASGLVWNFR